MKKYFSSSAHKLLISKRTKAVLKRRRKNKKLPKKYRLTNSDDKKTVTIHAPEIFSIRKNSSGMLDIFEQMRSLTKDRKNIFIDLSKVNRITNDAIIYMISQLDRIITLGYDISISGNAPKNQKCHDQLVASGFFNYIEFHNIPSNKSIENTVEIKHGDEVNPSIGEEITTFANSCLGKLRIESKKLYSTIIECMNNTKQHAYVTHSKYAKWWMGAVYDEESGKVFFSFYDNGFGIPYTIRRNITEKFKEYFSNADDYKVIFSALKGEFRTSTKKQNRGKGLPLIYESFKSSPSFLVISQHH